MPTPQHPEAKSRCGVPVDTVGGMLFGEFSFCMMTFRYVPFLTNSWVHAQV